jgi:hypothetical protein
MLTDVQSLYMSLEDKYGFDSSVHTAEGSLCEINLVAADGSPLVIGWYQALHNLNPSEEMYALTAVPPHAASLQHSVKIQQHTTAIGVAEIIEENFGELLTAESPDTTHMYLGIEDVSQPELHERLKEYTNGAVILEPGFTETYLRAREDPDISLDRLRHYGRMLISRTARDGIIKY